MIAGCFYAAADRARGAGLVRSQVPVRSASVEKVRPSIEGDILTPLSEAEGMEIFTAILHPTITFFLQRPILFSSRVVFGTMHALTAINRR